MHTSRNYKDTNGRETPNVKETDDRYQTNRNTEKWIDRQRDRQKNRKTYTWTDVGR
jgi:hypothetical protein